MRIFVAGFQHETNTFAPSKADWAAFESGSAFPAFSSGEAMLDRLGGTSLPMGGFIREARRRGWTLRALGLGRRQPVGACHARRLRAHRRAHRRPTRAAAASTRCTSTCTAPRWPSTWTMPKASCWNGCAR